MMKYYNTIQCHQSWLILVSYTLNKLLLYCIIIIMMPVVIIYCYTIVYLLMTGIVFTISALMTAVNQ
jgi:hypothetical protein